MSQDWNQVAAKTHGLPTLPAVLLKILAAANDPRSSALELANCLTLDPALAGRVLSLVNSAYTGLAQPVSTLQHAAALLGAGTIRSMAFSASLGVILPPTVKRTSFRRDQFWRHSLAAALAARSMARTSGAADPEEAYMAALLHDIGKLLFDLQAHASFARAVRVARQMRRPLWHVEREFLGLDHGAAGGMLLEHWGLPHALKDAVRRHHSPVSTSRCPPLIALVRAANSLSLSLQIGDSGDHSAASLEPWVADQLGLTPPLLKAVEYELLDPTSGVEAVSKMLSL